MPNPLKVLLLEDVPSDARLVLSELKQADFVAQWERVDNEQDFLARLDAPWDIILADYSLPQFDAPRALQLLHARGLDIPFIIVSGSIGEETAVVAMKEGAADYLLKDRLGRLGQAVTHALEQHQTRNVRRKAEEALHERTRLAVLGADIGVSLTRAGGLREMLEQCARSVVHNLEVPLVLIWTIDANDILELQATAGLDVRLDWAAGRRPSADFKLRSVVRDRIPFTGDLSRNKDFADPALIERERLAELAGFPLVVDGRLVGVIALFVRQHLSPATHHALAAAANQLAAGIDRKRAEERLKFTQFTIDHIDTAVFWLDADGKVFNVNDSACRLTALAREELLACKAFDLAPRVDVPDWQATWRDLRERRSLAYESTLKRRGHTEVPVLANATFLETQAGECCCMFVQDITERRKTELAQRKNELRFRAIFNQTFEFVGLLSSDGKVLEVNQPALEFRGLTLPQVVGVPLWETQWLDTSSEDREEARQAVLSAAKGAFVRKELRVRDKRGANRRFDFSVKPVVDESGRIELLIIEARDITEQKELEEQFRQAHKMEAVGKLAGGVAHDFNNLLTVINGYGEMLLADETLAESHRSAISEMLDAGMHAATLTSQLLAFSRKAIIEPKILDLNETIEAISRMLRRLIGEDIAVVLTLAPRLARIKADPGQLEQVILNLAVNARDAMPTGGRLIVETRNIELKPEDARRFPDCQLGRYVSMIVTDTGCGMPPEVQAKIFEPFFTTKGQGKGTGLGLATVYGIVKQARGHVSVTSVVNEGTTFEVLFPAEEEKLDVTAPAKDGAPAVVKGAETVLLVEDEEAVRKFARIALESQGYQVLQARKGEEAVFIALHHEGPIHLLVTDVVMPDMGGREVADAVRARMPEIRVLFVSGYMDDSIVRHGVEEATEPFLHKPFTPLGLARKVRAVLDAPPGSRTPAP